MNVIDLFSGVGGFSTGLEKAGFKIKIANEIDNQIALSYSKNHKKTKVINSDINNFIKIYEKEKNKAKIDLIVGGPPCQGFSMAGSRIRRNNFIDDPRNYLFKKYFDVIQKFEPDFFIMENVVGLASMKNGKILNEIELFFQNEKNFKRKGYFLQKKIFELEKIGVPQKRKRLIIIGSKFDFNINIYFDKIKKKHPKFNISNNLKEAIFDLSFKNEKNYIENQKYLKQQNSEFQIEMKGMNKKISNHRIFNHSDIVLDRIKRIKPGANWKSLKESQEIKSIHSGAYGRMEWDKKSMTITTRFDTPSAGRFIHPEHNRNITIREAARIQTFPDSFKFHGNKTSICKQIGNAVPPYLGEFLGYLIKEINNDNKREN